MILQLLKNLKLVDGLVYAGERKTAHEELCAIINDVEHFLTRLVPKKKDTKLDAAREALFAIECVYLRAAGFKKVPANEYDSHDDLWAPPLKDPKYRYSVYRHGHAINALKVWDRRGKLASWP